MDADGPRSAAAFKKAVNPGSSTLPSPDPGIGHRLDGWPNRDLNVGEIVALAPNLKPFTDLLGVDDAAVRKVLKSWGPSKYHAELV